MTQAEGRKCVQAPQFREDLEHWVATDRKTALKLLKIMECTMRDPFDGLYSPEQLKYKLENTWSRQLTKEHRVVYQVTDDEIVFLQGRYHYTK